LISTFLDDLGFETQIFGNSQISVYSRSEHIVNSISNILDKKNIQYSIEIKEVNPEWKTKLHGDFEAVEAGDYVVLSIDYMENYKGSKKRILINPAQAFGSGQHPTTKQCMELIQYVFKNHKIKTFIEPGCGSSILSILSLMCGAEKAVAFDFDFTSMLNAQENQHLNNVQALNICSGILPLKIKFDLVAANIFAHVLIAEKSNIDKYVENGKFLILSGIENSQAPEVEECFSDYNLLRKESYDGWTTLLYEKSI